MRTLRSRTTTKSCSILLTRNTYTSGRSEAFLTQVGWMVERHLSGGRPSLDEVASEMGMGRRSFQRMLSAAGTTFHKIVAGKRRLLAREYLRDSGPQPDRDKLPSGV